MVPPMHWLGRLGLLARGAVYAIVGVLAFKLAIGEGGKTADQQGAMRALAQEPNGKALLIALAVGLASYSAWRLASAWTGREEGVKDRASALLSGFFYGLLAVTAIGIVVGISGFSGDEDKATGGVLAWTYGREIIGAVGVVIVLEGIAQLVYGLRRKFCEKSRTDEMHEATEKAFRTLGMAGYCARGLVFGLIGAFLIKAAVEYDADEAIALDGALAKVSDATAGPFLLGTVAVGLMAFALYCVADARYRAL
jgi:uncharacterized protein DUF1206